MNLNNLTKTMRYYNGTHLYSGSDQVRMVSNGIIANTVKDSKYISNEKMGVGNGKGIVDKTYRQYFTPVVKWNITSGKYIYPTLTLTFNEKLTGNTNITIEYCMGLMYSPSKYNFIQTVKDAEGKYVSSHLSDIKLTYGLFSTTWDPDNLPYGTTTITPTKGQTVVTYQAPSGLYMGSHTTACQSIETTYRNTVFYDASGNETSTFEWTSSSDVSICAYLAWIGNYWRVTYGDYTVYFGSPDLGVKTGSTKPNSYSVADTTQFYILGAGWIKKGWEDQEIKWNWNEGAVAAMNKGYFNLTNKIYV